MNVAAPVNRASFSLVRLLFRMPEQSKGAFVFFSALPCILFLLSLGVSFLKPCSITSFLPFVAIVAAIMTYRFSIFGLVCGCLGFSLLFLIALPSLDPSMRLWQAGLVCNFSLCLFVLWLCHEEASNYVAEFEMHLQEISNKCVQSELDLQLAMKNASEQERELRDEIEQLKNEAELRRIEKIREEKHLALILTEIEMLTANKNAFIESARKAKEEALLHKELLAQEEKKALEASIHAKEALEHQKKSYDALEVRFANEKQNLENQVAALQKRERQKEEEAFSEKQLLVEHYEETLRLQEETVQQHKAAFIEQQEQLLRLQQLPPKVEIQTVTVVEEDKELKKAYALLENSTKQLRLQFNEKSECLNQTRKELFAAETKLLSLEKVNQLVPSEPVDDTLKVLESEIASLCKEVEDLEAEVQHLENLITH